MNFLRLLLLSVIPVAFAKSFDIYLLYRLDILAGMKITTIFKREFFATLKNYSQCKEDGQAIITMPNYSGGALRIGSVQVSNHMEYNKLIDLMNNLAKRVFLTGLNSETVSGNFRLQMKGLDIDPKSNFIYTLFNQDFPTDSFQRFVTFMKSFYFRLQKAQLSYRVSADMHLDRLVLGAVLDKDAINYKAFRERFKNLSIGFSIFESLVIKSNEPSGDGKASEFYFDLADHEPIIGAQNQFVLDDDQPEDEL